MRRKAEYQENYGDLDWRWTDEGLPYTIQDYHGSKGSVMDFTEDDWRVCKENGWTLDEVCHLCDEERFCSDMETLEHFFSTFPQDMPKEDAIAAVEDFYHKDDVILEAKMRAENAVPMFGNYLLKRVQIASLSPSDFKMPRLLLWETPENDGNETRVP